MPAHSVESQAAAAGTASARGVLDLLRNELGAAVDVSHAALEAVRGDKSGHTSAGAALAIVNARSIADVQAALRIASATRTPVVTRGAGTGLAGGAIAGPGEIVISALAMNRVLEVSAADELAVVEPGIINADLNAQLEQYGLWFTPDPASRAISTVGGNIATNAGGLLCAKYGVTREAVLGLKVVLADGRLLSLGHRTVKGVTGLDLTALMIGSEGALGIIVEATVRLRPIVAGARPTIGAHFESVAGAARAAAAIVAAGIRPAVLEILDATALSAIAAHLGLPDDGRAYLLVQTDGPGGDIEAENAFAVIRSLGGEAELSTDAAVADRLFGIRRAFHPAMEARGRVLIEDVCVPRSQLAAMFEAIGDIERRYGIQIPTVAHAGDGNLHPNFILGTNTSPDTARGANAAEGDDVPEQVWAAADELFLTALRLGGTLTGEHGIGILKKRWLRDELGDDQLALQRQVKQVFDPLGILNPGKVF